MGEEGSVIAPGTTCPIPEFLTEILQMLVELRNTLPIYQVMPAMLVRSIAKPSGERVRQMDIFTIIDGTKADVAEMLKMVLKISHPDEYAFITEGYYLSIDEKEMNPEDPIQQALVRGEINVSMIPDRKEAIVITFGSPTYEAIAHIDIAKGRVTGPIPTAGRMGPKGGTFSNMYST